MLTLYREYEFQMYLKVAPQTCIRLVYRQGKAVTSPVKVITPGLV